MAAKRFSSQNKSSSNERNSITPCNMHLTTCNMQKILHGYSSANGNHFRYMIIMVITIIIISVPVATATVVVFSGLSNCVIAAYMLYLVILCFKFQIFYIRMEMF